MELYYRKTTSTSAFQHQLMAWVSSVFVFLNAHPQHNFCAMLRLSTRSRFRPTASRQRVVRRPASIQRRPNAAPVRHYASKGDPLYDSPLWSTLVWSERTEKKKPVVPPQGTTPEELRLSPVLFAKARSDTHTRKPLPCQQESYGRSI